MSELTPQARAFLEAHKHAGEPTSADAARVRAALDRRLATTPPKGLTSLKVGVLVTVGLAGALLIRAARSAPEPVAAVPPPAPTRVALAPPAPQQQQDETTRDRSGIPEPVAPPASEGPASTRPAPGRVSPVPRPEQTAKGAGAPRPPAAEAAATEPIPRAVDDPAPHPAAEPPPEPERVVPPPAPAARPPDELALVSEAEDLLRQGQPRAALATLTTWEVHFARSGQFVQEALAGKIVALCSAGDLDAGRAEARAFFERFPRSVARNRIERACTQ